MTSQSSHGSDKRAKGKDGMGKWLSRLKGWMTTSEPSAQALKTHKKTVYKSSGISAKDPQAGAKLHLPGTTIPEDAIRPASGPDPDDLARRRAQERRMKQNSRSTLMQSSVSSRSPRRPRSQSMSSQSMNSSAMSSRQDSEPRSRPSYYPC